MTFPLLSVSGGPAACDLELALDGVPLRAVTAFTIGADVHGRVHVDLSMWARLKIVVPADFSLRMYDDETASAWWARIRTIALLSIS